MHAIRTTIRRTTQVGLALCLLFLTSLVVNASNPPPLIGQPFLIDSGPGNRTNPAVAYNSQRRQFLVAYEIGGSFFQLQLLTIQWNDDWNIYGRRVNNTGIKEPVFDISRYGFVVVPCHEQVLAVAGDSPVAMTMCFASTCWLPSAVVTSSAWGATNRPLPWITCTPALRKRTSTPCTSCRTMSPLRAWIAGQSGATLPSSRSPNACACRNVR